VLEKEIAKKKRLRIKKKVGEKIQLKKKVGSNSATSTFTVALQWQQ